MYKKICDSCGTTSYCASNDEVWLCPNCQHDITHLDAIDFDKNTSAKYEVKMGFDFPNYSPN
ncbi:hypothetical protein BTR23_10510 [Alkalihalophilus pseudofirmus]|nr:hypothetical protein BTR23_10510 [Alkalihalophilus pseudofirmus]